MKKYFAFLFAAVFVASVLAVEGAEALVVRQRPVKAPTRFYRDAGIDAGADAGVDSGVPPDSGVPADSGVPPDAGFTNTKAIQLDGVDEYISLADNAAWDATTQMSMCLWFKYDGTWAANKILVARYGASGTFTWRLRTNSSGTLRLSVATANNSTPTGAYQCGGFAGNTNYHLCVTFNAGTIVMYRDGSAIAGCTGGGTNPSSILDTSTPITIGASSAPSEYFPGVVDYFAWYDTDIGAVNAATAYQSGHPGDPATFGGALVFLPLGESPDTNTTLEDFNGTRDATGVNLESGDLISSPF